MRTQLPDTRTLSDRVADLIRDAIVRNELRPGDRLRQAQLAARFGVSRIPLREALRQLEAEGFISISPYRGAVVSELSVAEVRELGELAVLLESEAFASALPNLTTGTIRRAAQIEAEMEATDDIARWSELNRQFHAVLYELCHRPRLLKLAHALRMNGHRYMHLFHSPIEHRHAIERDHRKILAACRRKDRPEALAAMRRHLGAATSQAAATLSARSSPRKRASSSKSALRA